MASTPPSEVWSNGTQRWTRNGRTHRGGDKPAVVCAEGQKATGQQTWMVNGNFHRDSDKPAMIHSDGSLEWYMHGHLKRSLDSDGVVVLGSLMRQTRITNFRHSSLRYVFVRLQLMQTGT